MKLKQNEIKKINEAIRTSSVDKIISIKNRFELFEIKNNKIFKKLSEGIIKNGGKSK